MAAKKAPPRRNTDVIRCEKCGEEYSVTYKRCPFCDERPGRSYPAVGGKRASGNRPNPLQVGGLIVTLVLIIAAAVIVFKYVSPFLFGDKTTQGNASVSTSQSVNSSDAGSGSGESTEPQVTVNSLTLSRTDFTLRAGESYQLIATVDPEDAKVSWSSGDTSVATVDEYGNVTNVYTGSDKVKIVITAAAGDKSATCDVYCNGDGTGTGTTTNPDTTTPSTGQSLAPNSEAVITGASGGLNIRSGPGTNYESKASTTDGATVIVLEDAGNGWTKIKYATGGGNFDEGYVMTSYLQAK